MTWPHELAMTVFDGACLLSFLGLALLGTASLWDRWQTRRARRRTPEPEPVMDETWQDPVGRALLAENERLRGVCTQLNCDLAHERMRRVAAEKEAARQHVGATFAWGDPEPEDGA